MHALSTIADIRTAVAAARLAGQRIGCVPTMGALHAGHLSLIDEAHRRADFVIVTIFVNPSQFAPTEDLDQYPRPLEDDLSRCRHAGVQAVFVPEADALYPPQFETWVDLDHLPTILEGASRPGHFRGVATIVLKLFNIVQPDVACFGAKDYQQQTLIRRMCMDLNLPTEIAVCPIIRESDGLAMSSRNAYLSPEERTAALSISMVLHMAEELVDGGINDVREVESTMLAHLQATERVEPEYAVLRHPDTLRELTDVGSPMVALIAARVGKTRLIDNALLTPP